MPFIIASDSLMPKFYQWIRTLWFTKVDEARFLNHTAMLCPAWRLEGVLTIRYEAVAVTRRKSGDKDVEDRLKQSGTLRIPQYKAIFGGVDKQVPFAKLLSLCKMTDELPKKYEPGFVKWITGESNRQQTMDEFVEPQGAIIDRSPEWYQSWRKYVKNPTNQSEHPFVDHITNAIKSQSGLENAYVTVNSVTIDGFSTLSLAPLRIPVYFCQYSVPQSSTPYHLIVSGQDGIFHDGGQRPFTGVGGFMKFLFGGAFSK